MKGFKAIFAVCLALVGIGGAWADDSGDAARAATRRDATNTVTTTRKKTTKPATSQNTVSRSTDTVHKPVQTLRERTTTPRATTSISNVSRTSDPDAKSISARTTTTVASRATSAKKTPISTANIAHTANSATTRAKSATMPASPVRTSAARRASVARATANTPETSELRDAFMQSNNKQCREIYYTCMDEFCANKDSQLKRCACSSRLNEFDGVKRQLETAEEKMLDFSQRLLTVSMDAEDAAALNVATEGELAFNQKDTSKSQKILDEITKRLNTKFTDDSFDRNLTAISLSLNEDAAFDNVDSLMGASTTLKTGTELYAAAIPVCREMAAEVCTPEQLSIAESGYQMMIEQDCNTVKKSYQSQADAAREKIRESGALLDISRLNVYQDKNSDDILTCKSKMLEMLTDNSVCGKNMYKCLDTTGQYIDPSTGEAFLTVNLANLANLITRPTGNKTWTNMPGNEKFVSYLNSKKKFLAPAMEHCQNISDYVWTAFIEDALAQIKLAQDAKLEEVRQSCTTLTTQCLTDTAKSIEEFDARALSTFGVMADITVNAMCADVKNACTALLEITDGDTDWVGGMTEIATDNTYETILKTCREVGRACIIQTCKSISGNFGLCENIETSVNRKAIVNRTSCWQDVLDCVAQAPDESINRIMEQLSERQTIIAPRSTDSIPPYAFYKTMYGYDSDITISNETPNTNTCIESTDMNCVYDICAADGECNDPESKDCKICRIAEQIWGNCEVAPTTELKKDNYHNKIVIPKDKTSTLLSWFALNTGTDKMVDSCRDTTCGVGYRLNAISNTCMPESTFANDGASCQTSERFTTEGNEVNCCTSGNEDSFGNCCDTNAYATKINYINESNKYIAYGDDATTLGDHRNVCTPQDVGNVVATFEIPEDSDNPYYLPGMNVLICMGKVSYDDKTDQYPSGQTVKCDGRFIVLHQRDGVYYTPDTYDASYPKQTYKREDGNTTCTLTYDATTGWHWTSSTETSCSSKIGAGHTVTYQ